MLGLRGAPAGNAEEGSAACPPERISIAPLTELVIKPVQYCESGGNFEARERRLLRFPPWISSAAEREFRGFFSSVISEVSRWLMRLDDRCFI